MEKCINDYFIMNDEALDTEEFADEFKTEGKCIYEVIRIIDSKPLFIDEHLERFENSLQLAKSEFKLSMKEIKEYLKHLIVLNKIKNGNVKFVINKENIFMFSIPASYPSEELYEKGVKTILYFGERTNPNAKVVNDEFRNKVNAEIAKSGSFEAILVDRNGNVTEGSKSNIFFVKDGKVITAPVGEVLPGITRAKIIEAAKNLGLTVEEKNVNYEEIKDMNGLFISGTSPKVLPINEVEEKVKFTTIDDTIIRIKTEFDKIIIKNLRKYEGI